MDQTSFPMCPFQIFHNPLNAAWQQALLPSLCIVWVLHIFLSWLASWMISMTSRSRWESWSHAFCSVKTSQTIPSASGYLVQSLILPDIYGSRSALSIYLHTISGFLILHHPASWFSIEPALPQGISQALRAFYFPLRSSKINCQEKLGNCKIQPH